MTEPPALRPVELPPSALAELAEVMDRPAARVVRARWMGATSTVLRVDDLCVKVPHEDPAAVASCLTHARVAPVARRLGVNAPEVLGVHHLAGVPVPVVVTRFLRGGPLRRGEPHTEVWRAVGRDLARLHRATPDQVDVELRRFTQHEQIDPRRLAEAATDAGGLDPATALSVIRLRDRLADQVLPDDRPVLCHGDVHTENVLVHGDRYSGLVDFAGAGWLDAAWDFATVPASTVPFVLDGYRAHGGAVDGLAPRIVWCRLQLALHRTSGCADQTSEADAAVQAAERLLSVLA